MALYIESPQRVSAAIKHLREKKDITQIALARQIGLSRASLIRIENGHSMPRLDIFMKLVQALGRELALDFPLKAKG